MDHQTTVNRRRPGRVRQQLGDLVHDALTLAELQVELLKVDLRDARKGAALALALIGIGAVLALGSIPILLFAAAQGLVVGLGWPAPWAYLAVGGVSVLAAGLLVWTGTRHASGAMGTLQRSKTEFTETLRWFKGSLRTGPAVPESEIDNELWTTRSRI
jgi:hypothetical protein